MQKSQMKLENQEVVGSMSSVGGLGTKRRNVYGLLCVADARKRGMCPEHVRKSCLGTA